MESREGQEINNYRIVSLIGRGGFASIYLAEHMFLLKKVAIKILEKQEKSEPQILLGTKTTDRDFNEFLLEARRTSRLMHPHILRTLDFGIEEGAPFLVMDYASNGNVRQHHQKGEKIALSTVVTYVKQVADALQYMHQQKIIHRDIKPENIMLGEHNEILLGDLGIAVNADSINNQEKNNIAGTPSYMAPEQWQGFPTPASDQYALGIMTYEWLCGVLPFQGSNVQEMAYHHLRDSPPSLRDVYPKISPLTEFVVLTALSKDQENRFATVKGFANALENAYKQTEIPIFRSTQQPLDETIRSLPVVAALDPTIPQVVPSNEITGEGSFGEMPPLVEQIKSPEELIASKNSLALKEHSIPLFAIVRNSLEEDDRAFVGRLYSVQAGISKTAPENAKYQTFELIISDVDEQIVFDISLRVSENVELVTEWYQYLNFDRENQEPQFVSFTFKILTPGDSFIIVDFYHQQRWLKRIRHEFESIENVNLTNISLEV